jgi:hypothetical protein
VVEVFWFYRRQLTIETVEADFLRDSIGVLSKIGCENEGEDE